MIQAHQVRIISFGKIDETNGEGNDGMGFDIGLGELGLFFRYSPDGNNESIVVTIDSSNFALNEFQHISFVTDDSLIIGFVDGINVAQVQIPNYFTSLNFGSSNIYLGCPQAPASGFDAPVKSEIDNFQIWNTNLSEQQIQSFMNCPPTGNEEGLAGYWNFEEGEGNTAYDLSGNGNDGIINGATYITDIPEQYCQLSTVNGCDSIAVLNLTITQPDTSYTEVTACESYTLNDSTYLKVDSPFLIQVVHLIIISLTSQLVHNIITLFIRVKSNRTNDCLLGQT